MYNSSYYWDKFGRSGKNSEALIHNELQQSDSLAVRNQKSRWKNKRPRVAVRLPAVSSRSWLQPSVICTALHKHTAEQAQRLLANS